MQYSYIILKLEIFDGDFDSFEKLVENSLNNRWKLQGGAWTEKIDGVLNIFQTLTCDNG